MESPHKRPVMRKAFLCHDFKMQASVVPGRERAICFRLSVGPKSKFAITCLTCDALARIKPLHWCTKIWNISSEFSYYIWHKGKHILCKYTYASNADMFIYYRVSFVFSVFEKQIIGLSSKHAVTMTIIYSKSVITAPGQQYGPHIISTLPFSRSLVS